MQPHRPQARAQMPVVLYTRRASRLASSPIEAATASPSHRPSSHAASMQLYLGPRCSGTKKPPCAARALNSDVVSVAAYQAIDGRHTSMRAIVQLAIYVDRHDGRGRPTADSRRHAKSVLTYLLTYLLTWARLGRSSRRLCRLACGNGTRVCSELPAGCAQLCVQPGGLLYLLRRSL